ncbi:MAG: MerR family transcriptional regulator [Sphingomicrobium sp.]
MRIGELARKAGTKAETIRYYESVGLLANPSRTTGNYRDYGEGDLNRMIFIRHARGLGFEMDDVRSFLELDKGTSSSEDDRLDAATRHLKLVESKIRELRKLRTSLTSVINAMKTGHPVDGVMLEALGSRSPV